MGAMPAVVAEVRRAICRDTCDQHCPAFWEGRVAHQDPTASCPRAGWRHAWGSYGRAGAGAVGPTVPPLPERSSIPEKARRLALALVRWARGGFGLVGAVARQRRKRACEACDYWRPKGNVGLGECQAPGCGCTRLKCWLPTERCPLGKWPG